MKLSDLKKEKLDTWHQDNPQLQLVANLSGIIGMAQNVQDFSSDPATINRGKYIQEQCEKLMNLVAWMEKKW